MARLLSDRAEKTADVVVLAASLEDPNPERVLDLGELHAEGRLRHVAALGRPPEGELLGDGRDVLELPERERMRDRGHRTR